MFGKMKMLVFLATIAIILAACGGTPKDEIQRAIQESLDYYGEIPIVSIQKASNPEYFPSTSTAPPEAIWCVKIDTSSIPVDPIRMGPNPTEYLVVKEGLRYSVGMYGAANMFSRQIGCSNF